MQILIEELASGFPDGQQFVRVVIRLLLAVLLGAVIGAEREQSGKSAGLRTHMLVSLSSALFVLAPLEFGMGPLQLASVIQGVAAGIGFLGAGAILKVSSEREIQGLTTAAGIWMTAAVGVAVGLGRLGLAVVTVTFAWIILFVLGRVDQYMAPRE
jgi:putative Mg2+ transporter-C (MgtC) family protein